MFQTLFTLFVVALFIGAVAWRFFKRMDEGLGTTFAFMAKLFAILAFVWAVGQITDKVSTKKYTIYPFVVPKVIAENGLSGEAAAQRFYLELQQIQEMADSAKSIGKPDNHKLMDARADAEIAGVLDKDKPSFKVEVEGWSIEATLDLIANEIKKKLHIDDNDEIRGMIDIKRDRSVEVLVYIDRDMPWSYQENDSTDLMDAAFIAIRQAAMSTYASLHPAAAAQVYLLRGNYKLSMQYAARAYYQNADKPLYKLQALAIWARALNESGNKAESTARFAEAMKLADKLSPDDGAVLAYLANGLAAERDYTNAERYFKKLVDKDGSFTKHGNLTAGNLKDYASCLMYLGRIDEAENCLLRAFKMQSADEDAMYEMACIEIDKHNYSAASVYFDSILKISYNYNLNCYNRPDDLDSLFKQCKNVAGDIDPEKVVAQINNDTALQKFKYAWAYAGNLFIDNEQYDNALLCFNKAVKLDNGFAYGLFRQGYGFYRRGGDKDYQLSAAINYNLYRKGLNPDLDSADVKLKQVIVLRPGFADAHFVNAYNLTAMYDTLGAIDEIEKANELDGDNIIYYTYEGALQSAMGRYDKAGIYFAIGDYLKYDDLDLNYHEMRDAVCRKKYAYALSCANLVLNTDTKGSKFLASDMSWIVRWRQLIIQKDFVALRKECGCQ